MIYAKIFVEKDTDGTDVLVFDSSPKDYVHFLQKAGKWPKPDGCFRVLLSTTVYGFEHVAISPEARELFLQRLRALSSEDKVLFPVDFELGSDGRFSFRPDDVKEALKRKSNFPDAETCGTVRRLRHDEPFRICVLRGSHRDGLYKMITADNTLLSTLDLSSPVDPDELH